MGKNMNISGKVIGGKLNSAWRRKAETFRNQAAASIHTAASTVESGISSALDKLKTSAESAASVVERKVSRGVSKLRKGQKKVDETPAVSSTIGGDATGNGVPIRAVRPRFLNESKKNKNIKLVL